VPRVGVFGGSFNPIHFGHLLVADEVAEAVALDSVLFVPAGQPPHKIGADLAPARARLEMTRLAVQDHAGFEVSDIEIRREGPSYTVETLAALGGRGLLHLLIGSETFLDLLTWREPATVARLARLVVVPRNHTSFDPEAPAAQKVLAELGLPAFVPVARSGGERLAHSPAPLLVAAASLPISGSDLRRRAREGRSLRYRMPDQVAAYIRDHRVYAVER
jgi:nicotinate-nucleotide adenylyltransferase